MQFDLVPVGPVVYEHTTKSGKWIVELASNKPHEGAKLPKTCSSAVCRAVNSLASHAGRMVSAMTMKTVFTTGEAAKICKVSQQTIIRCFDNGSLKGFRVPGSRFRRIPRDLLFSFMKENGIPTDALESGKKKILVVDDDVDLVELIVDALHRDNRFEVRTANNGFDAGMQVKEFRPDVVILDVMLPDINGREVCQRVRSDPTMDAVKIICMSGMVEQEKVEDLRRAGANDFMQKPFSIEDLIDRSCDLLEIERSITS